MIIKTDETGTLEGLQEISDNVAGHESIKSMLILACDANGFTPEKVDPLLKEIPIPLFGGIFPALINGRRKMDQGCIVVGFNAESRIEVVEDLSSGNVDYEENLVKRIPDLGDMETMLLFVDGFSKRIGDFIESLFNIFGLEINYIGGGAGSLSLKQKPCLFTNEGIIQDSAVLVLLDLKSGVGVRHGWQSVDGPYKVTQSDRNTIKTLDWKPAFEVYKKAVEAHSGKIFRGDNFFEIAKAYPFGIAKIGTERIVRDPLTLGEENTLVCVGEVPEGSFVDILNGSESSLIEASGEALSACKKAFGADVKRGLTIFIDCISRVLFLEDAFKEELSSVHEEGFPLLGACTVGEIANSGNDYLEFYNKTAVVAILETL